MNTFFIKIKNISGSVIEIQRQAASKSDVESLVEEEFPECEIISIRMLLLD